MEQGRATSEARVRIEPGSVQETLVIPLYGRKICSERFCGLYVDRSAAELCERLDYDFSDLDRRARSMLWQFGALEAAMRQIDMEWEINDYLARHPMACVVNLGCGLDQTGRVCDNGTCGIVNVDMPEVIAAREELIAPGERECNVGCDLCDHAWMDEVDGGEGAIFFAAGVFHYLTFSQVGSIARELAERFGGSRLVFDTVGRLGRLLMRSTFASFGMKDYDDCLVVEDVAELEGLCPGARVSARGYMLGYSDMDDPAVTPAHRLLARIADGVVKMRIVRMDL